MKKLFSILVSMAMLLSCVMLLYVPAAAVEGDWTTYAAASQYSDDFDGDPKTIPGYEYTADGFHMIPGEWKGSTPWGHIQTKEKVDLKSGIFMQIRVDNFSFDTGDRWFNINLWDSAKIEPPVEGYGEGLQTLIRPARVTDNNSSVDKVEWYTGNFTGNGTIFMTKEKTHKTNDGKILLDVTVTWDGSSYDMDINGAKAPKSVIDYMNEKWGKDDSYAYVGVCTQNNKTGGTVELTVTKFGTTRETATTPKGDDSRLPENHSAERAPIASPDKIPEGQPAIFMNGNKVATDLKSMPKPVYNSSLRINEDYSLHITANKGNADSGVWFVKNDISYDIKDFPIGIVLMKNFCTCQNFDGSCDALESVSVYMLTGDSLGIGGNGVSELDMCYDPYVIGEDTYLYFYVDMMNDPSYEASGRINGACYDFECIDYETPGANEFDLVFMAWFRTRDDAKAYVESYLKDIGWSDEKDNTEESSDECTEELTEDPAGTETNIESGEGVTDEKNDHNNDENQTEDKKEESKPQSGCGSVIGFGAVAIAVIIGAAVIFNKKEN